MIRQTDEQQSHILMWILHRKRHNSKIRKLENKLKAHHSNKENYIK